MIVKQSQSTAVAEARRASSVTVTMIATAVTMKMTKVQPRRGQLQPVLQEFQSVRCMASSKLAMRCHSTHSHIVHTTFLHFSLPWCCFVDDETEH